MNRWPFEVALLLEEFAGRCAARGNSSRHFVALRCELRPSQAETGRCQQHLAFATEADLCGNVRLCAPKANRIIYLHFESENLAPFSKAYFAANGIFSLCCKILTLDVAQLLKSRSFRVFNSSENSMHGNVFQR